MCTKLFRDWLSTQFGSNQLEILPLAGDASFRLYFRVLVRDKSFIAMDATAEREKCPQFVAIAKALRAKELFAPKVYVHNFSRGYMLLSDLGDMQLLKQLNPSSMPNLYSKALDALSVLSTCDEIENYVLPHFTYQLMREELNLFREWFLEKYLGLTLSVSMQASLNQCFDNLASSCAAQPQVVMHRDYHSANLMLLPNNEIGILDFQDAFIGPVTYDLVSLLRDCYIECPKNLVLDLVEYYYKKINLIADKEIFIKWFDEMGIQRHLKALLTFSRKYCRDNNSNYVQFIPRTLNYILQISEKYSQYKELNQVIKQCTANIRID